MIREEVMVHSKTGTSLRGIIVKRYGRWLVLKEPQLYVDASTSTPLDGEVWIERANVDFVQVLR